MILSIEEINRRIHDSYELPNNVLQAVPHPMVTVRTSTYQHGPYIKDCIEGVLMQKTNFPIEFIIGEDFSTDGTREIVFDYAKKYPNIIRVITSDYNVGSKANGTRCIQSSRGKYMALCEGDDYWTDPLKLQKQVDLMETKPDCTICFHSSLINNVLKNVEYVVHDHGISNIIFKPEELISGKINMWTASILVKTEVVKSIPAGLNKLKFGDAKLKMWAASKGCIAYVGGGPMSVYRRGIIGAWSDKEGKDVSWEKERLYNHCEIVQVFKEILPIKYHKALDKYKDKRRKSYFYSLRRYYNGFEMVLVLMKNLKYINYNIFSPIGLIFNKILSKHREEN